MKKLISKYCFIVEIIMIFLFVFDYIFKIYLIGLEYYLLWKFLNFIYYIVIMIMMYYWIYMIFCLKFFLILGFWFVFILIVVFIDKNFNEKIYINIYKYYSLYM